MNEANIPLSGDRQSGLNLIYPLTKWAAFCLLNFFIYADKGQGNVSIVYNTEWNQEEMSFQYTTASDIEYYVTTVLK